MAKNTQEAEVIVTLNGERAKRAIKEMEQEYERLSQAANDAYKAGNDALGKKLDAQAQKLTRDMEITRRETKKFADIMKNINGASLKELRSAAKQLQSEINKLTPGTQAFITKSKQLQEVNTRIRQLTNEFKGLVVEEKQAAFSLKGLADGFNKYFGMVTAGVAAITGLSMAFRKAAEEAAKLDDTYADVMKTTGLLHEQVADLDKELMKIDTRTSREQLLLLARDAGKLGIKGKENILGFVRAADQIQVALGEDLGEGAIKQLGKIADVYGLTQSMGIEKSLLSIASAVNALGQASTASEGYLVEFTQRLAGVGAMEGISVQDLMGFASGLDQSSMKVEMAATAFQKFLMKMYEDTATFAGYAGMEVEKFSELLKKDANEAITTVLKSLHQSGGFDELVPMFKDMGLDGARAVQVLAAMAKNLGAVTEAQALANVEFEKATSVTDEYRTKNNNLQAQLEKARKEFYNASVALGQSLNPIMLKSTKIVTYLIKLLASHGKEIRNAIIAVAALTAIIKAQAIAEAVRTNALKLWNTVSKTAEFLSNKLFAAYYRLTGQTLKYAAAQKAANAAASKSVYGLIAIGVAALVYKITELNNKMEENVEITEKAQTTEERIAETYAEEKGKVDALNKIINNNNISMNKRKEALLELKGIVPGYHADLTEEGVLINNNTSALDAYLVKLRQKIRLEAYKEDFKEAEKAIMDYQKKLDEAQIKKQEMIEANGGVEPEKTKEVIKDSGNSLLGKALGLNLPSTSGVRTVETQPTEYGQVLEDIEKFKSGIADLTKGQDELMQKIGITIEAEKSEMMNEIDLVQKEYELELSKARKIDDQSQMKAEIKRIKEEKDLAIAKIKEKYAAQVQTEATENTNLTQVQFDFLKERYDKLTKKEQTMVDKGYASLTEDESKALMARYAKLTKVATTEINKEYKKKQEEIEKAEREQENIAKKKYADGILNEKQYEDRLREIKVEYIQKKIDLAQKYGEDETTFQQAMLDAQIEAQRLAAQEMDRLAKEADEKLKEENEKILEEKRKLEELTKEGNEVRASLRTPSEVRNDEMAAELMRLDKLHDAKQLSEEEYEEAVKKLRKKYAEEDLQEKLDKVKKYTEKVNSIMAEASNVVSAIKDAELAKAEANYQKELTAAGDNAEKREQVEAEYEQKKLDLQKKYADVDMGINIAKAIAAGALAAVEAYAAAGGNPVLGAVFAALIAVTTAAEVASIIAQRNAIKNASVNSSGSSASTNTGKRTLTGYDEGGNTPWAASDKTPVGIVHANEYVIPAWMKRREPVLIANLERYRKAGSRGRSGSMAKGFADGGSTSPTSSASLPTMDVNNIDWEAMREFNAVMRYCAKNGLFVKYGDILLAKDKHDNFKNQTTR